MAVKKKGLGKGLDSLIPDNKPAKKNTETVQKAEEKKEEMKDGVQMMKISMIEPNREQPRKKFEEDALLELADSIKLHGVLQPLLVRKIKDYYEYERGSCKELKCDNGKENDIYLRFELDELKKVGPIHRVEYGIRTLNYTTLYLLKTATTMHELYLSSRREIDVYKILKKISKDKNINLRKENDGFYIGSDFVKVLDNGDIKLSRNKVSIKDILYIN